METGAKQVLLLSLIAVMVKSPADEAQRENVVS